MARTATLHIKLDPETDSRLRELAIRRKTSKGQLVRQAVATCYQTDFLSLPLRQQRAMSAYEGGYISLGKLSEAMGMDSLATRAWLSEHGIAGNCGFAPKDVENA